MITYNYNGDKMYKLIQNYMNNLDLEKFNMIAIKNDVFLSKEELDFSYNFFKKNWETYLSNPNLFNLEKYKKYYSEENFIKIKKLYSFYYSKYHHYL